MRNDEIWRNVYKKQFSGSKLNYRDALSGRVSCFDEVLINKIVAEQGGRMIVFPFADFYPRFYRFNLIPRYSNTDGAPNYVADVAVNRAVFSWTENGLFRYWVKDGKVCKQEFAYAHFFRRPMEARADSRSKNGFCIVPNAFVNQPTEIDVKYILRVTKARIYWKYLLPRLRICRLLDKFFGKAKAAFI